MSCKNYIATGLLVLMACSALLELVEATNNKNRFDALAAGQQKKPKRGAAGTKDGSTKTRAERFGECMNKINEKVGELLMGARGRRRCTPIWTADCRLLWARFGPARQNGEGGYTRRCVLRQLVSWFDCLNLVSASVRTSRSLTESYHPGTQGSIHKPLSLSY